MTGNSSAWNLGLRFSRLLAKILANNLGEAYNILQNGNNSENNLEFLAKKSKRIQTLAERTKDLKRNSTIQM